MFEGIKHLVVEHQGRISEGEVINHLNHWIWKTVRRILAEIETDRTREEKPQIPDAETRIYKILTNLQVRGCLEIEFESKLPQTEIRWAAQRDNDPENRKPKENGTELQYFRLKHRPRKLKLPKIQLGSGF